MGYLGRVAVIMRTKDRPLFLERAFESVLSQTFTDWFLVLINDGGDTSPIDWLVEKHKERFAGRISVLHLDGSNGTSNGRVVNEAIADGNSDYVVIHDDDDSWAPHFLFLCVNSLERVSCQFPSVQGVVSYSLAVWEHLERGSIILEDIQPFNKWIPHGMLSLSRMAEGNFVPPISFLYRREALKTTGNYRENLLGIGDWEFTLRFMSHFDIYLVPYAVAFYHLRRTATGVSGNTVISGAQTHSIYNQYLRNELIRQDVHGAAGNLGTFVDVATRTAGITEQLGPLQARTGEIADQLGPLQAQMEQISKQLNLLQTRIGEISGLLNQLAYQVTVSIANAQALREAKWKRSVYLPVWIVLSSLVFVLHKGKRTLLRKFIQHWRQEGPRRAFSVLARFGYLAAGGKKHERI